jgi:hypothetical protein
VIAFAKILEPTKCIGYGQVQNITTALLLIKHCVNSLLFNATFTVHLYRGSQFF